MKLYIKENDLINALRPLIAYDIDKVEVTACYENLPENLTRVIFARSEISNHIDFNYKSHSIKNIMHLERMPYPVLYYALLSREKPTIVNNHLKISHDADCVIFEVFDV